MGGKISKSSEPNIQNEIDKQLAADRERLRSEVKLLFLGAGDSGKSTIAKQLKLLHQGFSDDQIATFRTVIYNNVLEPINVLIEEVQADPELELAADCEASAERLVAHAESFKSEFTPEMAEDVTLVWSDPAIKAMFDKLPEFQLNDAAAYFFGQVDRIASAGYIPSDVDILRSRAKTSGIVETHFSHLINNENIMFHVLDVGGQKSERKKWIHVFQDVSALVYTVALSEYDLVLSEDGKTNRMQDSLQLFKSVVNNKWFFDTPTILFFNKMDLFEEKIKTIDLKVCFPDYKGGCDKDAALEYIKKQFLNQNENETKNVHVFETTATDPEVVKDAFRQVSQLSLKRMEV